MNPISKSERTTQNKSFNNEHFTLNKFPVNKPKQRIT